MRILVGSYRWLAHSVPDGGKGPLESPASPTTHITFIHGIANKPTAESLLQQWLGALAAFGGIDLKRPDIAVSMVYWADVLYTTPATEIPADSDEASFDPVPSDWKDRLKPQEQFFVESLRGRILSAAEQKRATLSAEESSGDIEERVPLPWFIKEPVMERILRDVHHYLFNVEYSPRRGETYKVRDEIRQRFVAGVRSISAPRQIVVSHSMGTVIAYDCLKRVPGCPAIDTLMTIGSPLGLDEVQDMLRPEWSREDGFPSTRATHWVNLFDRLDPVCGFDPSIANDFKKGNQQVIEDINEQNSGWWRHDIQKYLGGPRLRAALNRALQTRGERPGSTTATEAPSIGTAVAGTGPKSFTVFLRQLKEALDSFDHERTRKLCDAFVTDLRKSHAPPTEKQSAELLSHLRRKRSFREMRLVADALIEAGQVAPRVRRQYVQAMIDEGAIAAGLALARDLARDLEMKPSDDSAAADELAEARGLIARCYKQWFVQGGDPRFLKESFDVYHAVYRENPSKNTWHGINAVALLAQASSDPAIPLISTDYREIARAVLAEIERLDLEGKAQSWDRATAMEACIALRRTEDALRWARDYIASEGTDAFELASTLRQLKEIWQLDPAREPGSLLFPLLEAELLKKDGGQVTLDAPSLVAMRTAQQSGEQHLQRVYGLDSYTNFKWLAVGQERCRGVARIETRTGKAIGTGFLVRGRDLNALWGDEYLLLTNNHVLSDRGGGIGVASDGAVVKFHAIESTSTNTYAVATILAQSPSNELDFTVARLEPAVTLPAPWPIARREPNPQSHQRLYAIGHPLGGDLAISMQDNLLLDFKAPLVHYRTPTDPGNSGSPIFDSEWNLVALHHAGSKQTPRLHGEGTYEANEGIWIESIRRYLEGPRPAQSARARPATIATTSRTTATSFQSTGLTESSHRATARKAVTMPDLQKQEQLRRFVSRIASPDRLEAMAAEAPAIVESVSRMESAPAPVLASADLAEAAESAVRKLQTGEPLNPLEMSSMEAIVLPRERPVVFIENDSFSTPESPWEHFSTPEIKGRIEAAIPSIGRVELPDNPQIPFGGTAFVVGPDLLMTNRHVAELFATGLGRQVTFRAGQSAGWDRRRERTSPPGNGTSLTVRKVLMIHPFWDMALLEVSGLQASQRPLALAVASPEQLVGIDVAVIGYPAKDLRNDSDLQDRIFHRTFYVKRLQPGKINARAEISSFGNTVNAMTHDSSTLGGNSGSAIIDVRTGAVVGLHFAGLYLKSNYAVPAWELSCDRRVVDLGVKFTGRGGPENPLVTSAWKRLGPEAPDDVNLARRPVRRLAGDGGTRTTSVRFELGNLRFALPIEISVTDPESAGGMVVETIPGPGLLEAKAPVVFPRLDKRNGYAPDFLKLGGNATVPLPDLTGAGKKIVSRLDDGDYELKYHNFSVVMHKQRRLALFTASNVDYRDIVRKVNGKKPSRRELNGFDTDTAEMWVTDERIPENHQLPDKFYTKDGGAFDKGHIVRRDDVCWGSSTKEMQMGNGDTFHTTNCSPQVSGFNQSAQGVDNWGDLEVMIQQQTKAERVIVFAGPVLDDENDLRFEGFDKRGDLSIQIPSRFWKIVVAKGASGPEAFGFVLEQDLSKVPLEFAVPAAWRPYMERIAEIEEMLFGHVSLDSLKKIDQYKKRR